MRMNIALVKGDGIGPEIVDSAVQVLETVAARCGHSFAFTELLAGGCAIDAVGIPLPQETVDICLQSDSVLLGAVGGPKWDGLPGGNTLPSTPPGNKPMLQDLEGNPATFAVTVSPDKKTARVTATMTQQINFLGSMQIDGKMPGIGVVKLTFDFQLNLSAHEQGQGVTDLRIGQEILPFDRLN